MAVNSSFKLQDEELSCPICFEDFSCNENSKFPKLLLCLHTFCLNCVQTLRKLDGSLQCSICRTTHKVYQTMELLDNYVIIDYLRRQQLIDDEKLAQRLGHELSGNEERSQQMIEDEILAKRLREEFESNLESIQQETHQPWDQCGGSLTSQSVDSSTCLPVVPLAPLNVQEEFIYRSASSSPDHEDLDESSSDSQESPSNIVDIEYEEELSDRVLTFIHSLSDEEEDDMETAHSSPNNLANVHTDNPSEASGSSVLEESEIHSEIASEIPSESDSDKEDSTLPHLNDTGTTNNPLVISTSDEGSESEDNCNPEDCDDWISVSDEDTVDMGDPLRQSRPPIKKNSVNENAQGVIRINSSSQEECNMQ